MLNWLDNIWMWAANSAWTNGLMSGALLVLLVKEAIAPYILSIFLRRALRVKLCHGNRPSTRLPDDLCYSTANMTWIVIENKSWWTNRQVTASLQINGHSEECQGLLAYAEGNKNERDIYFGTIAKIVFIDRQKIDLCKESNKQLRYCMNGHWDFLVTPNDKLTLWVTSPSMGVKKYQIKIDENSVPVSITPIK